MKTRKHMDMTRNTLLGALLAGVGAMVPLQSAQAADVTIGGKEVTVWNSFLGIPYPDGNNGGVLNAPGGITTTTLGTSGNATVGGALSVTGVTTTKGITNTGLLTNIGNAKIDGDLEVTGKVDSAEVNAGKVNAGEVNTDKVNAGEVNTDKVNAGEVNTDKVNAGEVNTAKVNAGEVNTDKVNAGEVNTAKVNATTGNFGTLNATTGNITNDLTVGHNAIVKNNLIVENDAEVKRHLSVGQDINVGRNAVIEKNLIVKNDAEVERHLSVGQDVNVGRNAIVNNDLIVKGNSDLQGHLNVGQDVNVGRNLSVEGMTNTNGINNNGQRIQNVGAAVAGTDAVNLNQLNERFGEAQKYTDNGVAAALAIPSMPTLAPGKGWAGMAVGNYGSATAVGLAVGYQVNERWNLGLGVSQATRSGGKTAVKAQAGFSW